MHVSSDEAWNNFVMHCDPNPYAPDTPERSAALAGQFMGLANNGGLFHFLEATCDFDAKECLASLHAVGARQAASQLDEVLRGLGVRCPPCRRQSAGPCWISTGAMILALWTCSRRRLTRRWRSCSGGTSWIVRRSTWAWRRTDARTSGAQS